MKIVAGVSFVISILLLATHAFNDVPMIIFGYTVVPLAVSAGMYWIATAQPWFVRFFLANKLMVFVGTISYGVYLIHIWIVNGFESIGTHQFIEHRLGRSMGVTILFFIELICIVLLASLSYFKLELPVRRSIAKRWSAYIDRQRRS